MVDLGKWNGYRLYTRADPRTSVEHTNRTNSLAHALQDTYFRLTVSDAIDALSLESPESQPCCVSAIDVDDETGMDITCLKPDKIRRADSMMTMVSGNDSEDWSVR